MITLLTIATLLSSPAEVIVVEKPQTGLVWVGAVVKTGAASGQTGEAYATAKGLLRGTKTRSRADIATEIDGFGASIDVEVTHEATWVTGRVLARYLPEFMAIFSDVLLHPTFPAGELRALADDIRAEVKADQKEDRALGLDFFHRALYAGNAYGRPVKSGAKIAPAKLRAFHKTHFVSGNVILGAAGDVTRKQFEALAKPLLSGLPAGASTAPLPKAVKPKGIRIVLVDKPERTENQIYLGHAAVGPADGRYYPFLVANNALGGMFTARLNREVRVKRGWSYGASSRVVDNRGAGHVFLWTFPGNDDAVPTVRLLLELYRAFGKHGITAQELLAARDNLANKNVFRIETPEKRLREMIRARVHGRSSDQVTAFPDRVREVDLEKVNQAAAQVVDTTHLVLVMVCTADKFQKELSAIPGVERVEVVKFDGEYP